MEIGDTVSFLRGLPGGTCQETGTVLKINDENVVVEFEDNYGSSDANDIMLVRKTINISECEVVSKTMPNDIVDQLLRTKETLRSVGYNREIDAIDRAILEIKKLRETIESL